MLSESLCFNINPADRSEALRSLKMKAGKCDMNEDDESFLSYEIHAWSPFHVSSYSRRGMEKANPQRG